jgi:hypothetical protein
MFASGECRRNLHEYRAVTRYIPLMVIGVWACAGIGLYVAVTLRSDTTAPLEKQLFFWVPWLVLFALGIWGQLSYNKRLKPIELTMDGLWIGRQGRTGAVLVPWERIERVERLPSSSRSGAIVPSKGGIYICENGRSFVIYEQIRGFEDLWRELQEGLAQRGIIVTH